MDIFLFILFIALIISVIYIYNRLVYKKNQVENALRSIDVKMKKRYDEIPNLVDVVQEYMGYEEDVLKDITELRTEVMKNDLPKDEEIKLNNQISDKLGGIIVAVENYPELKASENFKDLQRSLNEVESQIAAARRTYNSAVTDYNNSVEMFPSNIIASMFGYQNKELFMATAAEKENVKLSKHFE